jgi:nicotinamide-nucleotide amidase
MGAGDLDDEVDSAAERLAHRAHERGHLVAVAESLTGGALTAALARAPDAATWLRGGIVAYSEDVKHEVLGVGDVPVVSEPCAAAMAEGAARLLGADIVLAATGVGGPDPQDGVEPGTVWTAVHHLGATHTRLLRLDGEPDEVLQQTCLGLLSWAMELLHGDPQGGTGGRRGTNR